MFIIVKKKFSTKVFFIIINIYNHKIEEGEKKLPQRGFEPGSSLYMSGTLTDYSIDVSADSL